MFDTNDRSVAPMGRPRDADKQARLARPIRAEESLFLEKGYGKVSLEAIARQAHEAVRTIYVKFGGKAGLWTAVIVDGRSRHRAGMTDMENGQRPLGEILSDFALRMLELLSLPTLIKLHRMVVAEAETMPEPALTFYRAGPQQTRERLARFFSRPDITAQLDSDLPPETLSLHLLNCLLGDQTKRILFGTAPERGHSELRAQAALSLRLFLRGVRRR